MSESVRYYSTGSNIFCRLDNILIIPFGVKQKQKPSEAITFENTSPQGSFLKFNSPCVIIDKTSSQPLCIKHIPWLIEEEIKTIQDPEFESKGSSRRSKDSGRVWKYFQYLKNKYAEYVGIKLHPQTKNEKAEKNFLDYYFKLCWLQLEDRKKHELKNKISIDGPEDSGFKFPLNDGRAVFEALLPIHEGNIFFEAVGLSNRIEQTEKATDLSEGYCRDENYILPVFGEKRQNNKQFLRHTKIDFLFWTGQRFLFYELDGKSKLLSQYIEKNESLEASGNYLKHLTNEKVDLLTHIIEEQTPNFLERESKLRDDFPDEVLKFWELTPSKATIRKLCRNSYLLEATIGMEYDEYHLGYKPSPKTIKDEYEELPYHLQYFGFLNLDRY